MSINHNATFSQNVFLHRLLVVYKNNEDSNFEKIKESLLALFIEISLGHTNSRMNRKAEGTISYGAKLYSILPCTIKLIILLVMSHNTKKNEFY